MSVGAVGAGKGRQAGEGGGGAENYELLSQG